MNGKAKPLAQLWVDYLTHEAGAAPAAPASPARAHAAASHFAASVPKYV